MQKSRLNAWLITLLLLLAVALFRSSMTLPVWVDEGYTVFTSQQENLRAIKTFTAKDDHPPLFYFLLHGWSRVAGDDLLMLRIPGILIALLSIAMTYRFALDIFDMRAAFVAGLIVATSDIVIGLATSARHYHLYMLMAILST